MWGALYSPVWLGGRLGQQGSWVSHCNSGTACGPCRFLFACLFVCFLWELCDLSNRRKAHSPGLCPRNRSPSELWSWKPQAQVLPQATGMAEGQTPHLLGLSLPPKSLRWLLCGHVQVAQVAQVAAARPCAGVFSSGLLPSCWPCSETRRSCPLGCLAGLQWTGKEASLGSLFRVSV